MVLAHCGVALALLRACCEHQTGYCLVCAPQAAVPLVYIPLEAVVSKWYGESEKMLAGEQNWGRLSVQGPLPTLRRADGSCGPSAGRCSRPSHPFVHQAWTRPKHSRAGGSRAFPALTCALPKPAVAGLHCNACRHAQGLRKLPRRLHHLP